MGKMLRLLLAVKERGGKRVRRPHTYDNRSLSAPSEKWAAWPIPPTAVNPPRPKGILLSSRVVAGELLKADIRRLALATPEEAFIGDCGPATGSRSSREKKEANFYASARLHFSISSASEMRKGGKTPLREPRGGSSDL